MTTRCRCARALIFAMVAGVICLLTPRAHGDQAPTPAAQGERAAAAAAQALFEQGRQLLLEGNYAEACAKLSESERLEPAAGTLLNLAYCHEQLGKTATAYVEYQDVLALSLKDGDGPRATLARERIAALEPILARLVIRLSESESGVVEIELDGTRLGRDALGVPIPVDPGAHRISGRARQAEPFSLEIVVDRAGATIDVVVPPSQAASSGGSAASQSKQDRAAKPPVHAPSSTSASAPSSPERAAGGRKLRPVLGGAALALSALTLAAGAYFGVDAISAWSKRDRHCPEGVCDGTAVTAYHRAKRSATTADVCVAIGAVSGAIGVGLLVYPNAARAHQSPDGRGAEHEDGVMLVVSRRF